jgi:hypothetical protein
MANNFDSNITPKLAKVFLNAFETDRVISRTLTPSFYLVSSIRHPVTL